MTAPATFEHFDDLSPAESAFIALQQNPREYGRWAKTPAGLLAVLRLKEK